MMKSLFLLVVLLPLCHSSNRTLELTSGIRTRLTTLNDLYVKRKVNITSWDTVNIPSTDMQNNTSACMNVFKKELKHLLNLTVVEDNSKHLIDEITANLKELQATGNQEDQRCTVKRLSRRSKEPFTQYINFLKKFRNNLAHS